MTLQVFLNNTYSSPESIVSNSTANEEDFDELYDLISPTDIKKEENNNDSLVTDFISEDKIKTEDTSSEARKIRLKRRREQRNVKN